MGSRKTKLQTMLEEYTSCTYPLRILDFLRNCTRINKKTSILMVYIFWNNFTLTTCGLNLLINGNAYLEVVQEEGL